MDTDSPIPPYLQIAGELEERITSGQWPPGTRLPSITRLMQEHEVGKGTAVRAIAVLKRKKLVQTRQGWGTFVA